MSLMKRSEIIQKQYLHDVRNAEVSSFQNSALRADNVFICGQQPAFRASLMFQIFVSSTVAEQTKNLALAEFLKELNSYQILLFLLVSYPNKIENKIKIGNKITVEHARIYSSYHIKERADTECSQDKPHPPKGEILETDTV